jgi:hypothetical protein
MNKKHYFFFVCILAAAAFMQYDVTKRIKTTEQNRLAEKTSAATEAEALASNQNKDLTITPEAQKEKTAPSPELFVKRFKEEVFQISQLQDKPEEVEQRLKGLAKLMGQSEVEALYEVISDEQNNGDERAMAVELLSLKNDTASLMALQNFVGNKKNVSGKEWNRKKELETVLRAQAVEGIAGYPEKEIAISTLSFLQSRVDDKFLNDRIGRATTSILSGNNKTLQQQDDEALKKLVE